MAGGDPDKYVAGACVLRVESCPARPRPDLSLEDCEGFVNAASLYVLSQVKGKIPADGSLALQVAYTPISTGKGFAEPHSVEIDRNSINFGNLELGKVRKVFLRESMTDATPRYHQNQDQVPRPMPLAQKHVDMYRARQMAERTAHARAIYDVTSSNNPMSVIWNEFFLDDTDSRREIYLLEQHVEFGAASEVGVGDYKQITVHNNTEVKQTAMFMIPPDNYVKQPEGAGEITMT
eukprot:760400-Hanusia_phi.AAC.1